MSTPLNIKQRNAVLKSMIKWLKKDKDALLHANKKDMESYPGRRYCYVRSS